MTDKLITNLEAATRQLDTAISLWFTNSDTISIHTLACSAYQTIHDMNKKKGHKDPLYDSHVVNDEYRREMVNLLEKNYDLFKHAEKDLDGLIEFDETSAEVFILFSILGLELLGIKHSDIRDAFIIWDAITNPERLTEKGKKKFIDNIPPERIEKALNLKRSEFFDHFKLFRS